MPDVYPTPPPTDHARRPLATAVEELLMVLDDIDRLQTAHRRAEERRKAAQERMYELLDYERDHNRVLVEIGGTMYRLLHYNGEWHAEVMEVRE